MSSANCVPPLRFYSLPLRRNRPMKVTPLLPNSTFSRPPLFQFHHFVLFQRSFLPSNYSRLCSKPYAFGANMSTQGRDGTGQPSLDVFLSFAEVLCIVPSVVFSVGGVIGLMFPGTFKLFQVNSGNVFFVCQFFLLVTAVIIGGLIRQRQWQRIYRDDREASVSDLVQRIEKVEEDLRSSVKIVRVLSRQLEKLGIRFRVTRKALKDPIAEAAALAQKNSEATRALALQEDVLEKELGEIQKVLLAMQEQQQKQLDLILAVAKAGRLFRDKPEPATDGAVGKIDLVQGPKKESELLAESKTGGRRGSPK